MTHHRHHTARLFTILCGLFASLCAVPVLAAVPPQPLRVAVAYAPKSLDPAYAADAAAARLLQLTNPALLKLNDKFQPESLIGSCTQPSLAQVLCRLPEHDVFADGTPLTAESLAGWYRFLQGNPRSPASGALKGVSITVPQPTLLSFRLASPSLLFTHTLAEIPLAPAPADPSATGPLMGARTGLGPYVVKGADALGNVTLARRAGANGPAELQFLYVADATTRFLKLRQKEVDVLMNDLPPEIFTQVRRLNDGRKQYPRTLAVPSASYTYLGYNLKNPVLNDPNVRKAIAHIVDRPAIRRYLLGGQANPASSLLPPGHALAWKAPEEQPEPFLAEQLLDETPWFRGPGEDGTDSRFTLTLTTSTDALSQRLAQVLQQQLAEAGITLKIRPTEWGAFYDLIRKGQYDMVLLTWTGAQPPSFLYYVFHGSQTPPNGLNRGGLNDPQMNAALESLMSATTQTQLAAATRKAQQLQAELRPYLPLYRRQHTLVSRPGIFGCTLDAAGSYLGLLNCR